MIVDADTWGVFHNAKSRGSQQHEHQPQSPLLPCAAAARKAPYLRLRQLDVRLELSLGSAQALRVVGDQRVHPRHEVSPGSRFGHPHPHSTGGGGSPPLHTGDSTWRWRRRCRALGCPSLLLLLHFRVLAP